MHLPEFHDTDALALDERLQRRDRRRLMLAGVAAIALHVGTAVAIAFAPAVKPVEPPGEMEISIDLEPAVMSAESASAGAAAASAPQAETPPEPEPLEEVAEETPPEPTPPEPTPPEPEPVVEPPPPEPLPEPVEEVVQPEPLPEPEPEPVTEPPPEEVVEAEPPPPAEQAEVVLPSRPKPKPKPVAKPKVERAEKVEPTPAAKPKPKPVAKPKPASASSAASAASSARKTDVGGSGAKADPNELARYIGRLRSALERRKRYPSAAGGVSGTASLSFTINRSGQVTSFRITRSSGNAALDAATRAMVQGASLPAIPAGLPATITVGVPVNFTR
jgi:protein TonB